MQPDIAKIRLHVDWRALRIALQVARTQSIKRAAENLNLTESTVSRYVGSLEEHLGFFLFERSSTGMKLTRAGIRLMHHLYRAEGEIETGLEAALELQSKPAGSVRLTTVPSIANRVLAQHAPDLLANYPELELELIGVSTDLSMTRRETDIAIRLSRPARDMEAITRKIGKLDYSVYAALRNSNNGRTEKTPQSLPWITYERDMSSLPQARWIDNFTKLSGEKTSSLRFYDAEGLIGAALAGVGKILLPSLVAEQIPELEELDGYSTLPSREVWLLVHPNIASTERVQVVVSWLKQVFSKESSRTPR